MGDALDAASPVRAGEEIDVAALRQFLEARGRWHGEPLAVQQFPRGFSNLTYLIRSGDTEYVLRRPPLGLGRGAGTAHDMLREARILAALGRVYARVPRLYEMCEDEAVLGAPFYLMERVTGVILRDRVPSDNTYDAVAFRRLSTAAIDTLAEIHAVDVQAAGLRELGNPDGYVERQVTGWSRRYQAAQTGPQPAVERAAGWLAANRPPERGAALVHNDFKYDNLVLDAADPSRVRAVLDWEMATIGDPLLDLGTTLAYWVEAGDPPALRALGIGLTALPGNLTRGEVVARYAAVSGRDVGDATFYFVFGLFKVAVIAQQIFARFVRGLTSDPRFARLDLAVGAIGEAAVRALESGRLSA